MSPLDKQLVTRKIKLIEKDLIILNEEKPTSERSFLKDTKKQILVERLLERIVGRLIDINYHILSEEYSFVPQDYKESFVKIGAKGVVPIILAKEMSRSAGLRNVLAHEYDEIDYKKVYKSISLALNQLPKYLKYILKIT
jgi:uncharacterized protein YutE (UPF0331/DUF86 family)